MLFTGFRDDLAMGIGDEVLPIRPAKLRFTPEFPGTDGASRSHGGFEGAQQLGHSRCSGVAFFDGRRWGGARFIGLLPPDSDFYIYSAATNRIRDISIPR